MYSVVILIGSCEENRYVLSGARPILSGESCYPTENRGASTAASQHVGVLHLVQSPCVLSTKPGSTAETGVGPDLASASGMPDVA